jgi:hypothetical protein
LPYFPPAGATAKALAEPGTPILVTEGEKKAARADQDGFACIALAGVWAWQKKRQRDADDEPIGPREPVEGLAAIPWKGRPVYIVFDSDAATNANVNLAEKCLADHLSLVGANVKIVRLPADKDGAKCGLDDYLVAHGADALRELLAKTKDKPKPAAGKKGRRREGSQADELVSLANAAELFHNADGEGFGTIHVEQHHETLRLKTKGFRRWLARTFHAAKRRAPNAAALQDALAVLEGKAQFDGKELPVAVRIAGHGDSVILDLADKDWQAVEITSTGWRLTAHPPVKFIRPRGLLALPKPVAGGSLDDLRPFVNVVKDPTDHDWRLLVAWLIAAMRPRGPYPVLVLHGEQGSAKSTTAKILRGLIDPNTASARSQPREPRDLIIAATNSWTVSLDNLSYLPPWLSDSLCRLATGGGFGTRELFTDNEEIIFDAQRPIILNGITELATRSDLLDRSLILYLPAIPEKDCRPEEKLWADFEQARPKILGAILDAVSGALLHLPRAKLSRLPRMADFALWATAAESPLGWKPGAFMAAYDAARADANELALESSAIAQPLRDLVEQSLSWCDTATKLLETLAELAGEKASKLQSWPKTPRGLTAELRRIVPNLRRSGIKVTFPRPQGHKRTKTVQLERVAQQQPARSAQSAPGATAEKQTPCADDPCGLSADCQQSAPPQQTAQQTAPSNAEVFAEKDLAASADCADRAGCCLHPCSEDSELL